MDHKVEEFVKKLVDETDVQKEERDGLYNKWLNQVYRIRDEYLKQGKSLEDATHDAMETFEKEGKRRERLAQAIPVRKEWLVLLAGVGFLFTIGQYLYVLIGEKVALFHLLSNIVGHSVVLFLALYRPFLRQRKIWLSLALLFHVLLLIGNAAVHPAARGDHPLWFIGFGGMVLFNVILLYRTVLAYPKDSRTKTHRRILHLVNITLGLITGIPAVFVYWFMIAFGMPAQILFYFFVPLIGWILLYIAQVLLARRYPKAAVSSLALTVIMLGLLWWPWLAGYFQLEIGFGPFHE
ncbi:hypothetical protein [Alteribacillus iranensis]|uniref:Uncharacterized protein n=1 Tax=Alteribacillus iranensis TaxID=930128 RepID=A0A1I2D288_9BACI|nr:hypothetical protein [Alteribacillus iranensis]SFE74636.1 hypothetical protein SAMN05192532_103355 [Alteribacillus iranensis]